MSKQKALKALQILQADPSNSNYIVTYNPFSLLREKDPRVYQASRDLQKFFRHPEIECDQAFFYGDNKITFFYPEAQTYPAKRIQADWGDQYFVDYSEEKPKDRLKALSQKIRVIVTTLSTLAIFLVTTFSNLRTEILNLLPKPKTARQEAPIEQILEATYFGLPHPKPNGLFFWEYQQDCNIRTFAHGFSPTLKNSTFAGIKTRRTDEPGWSSVFAEHKNGSPSRIRITDLTPGNALRKTMEDLRVFEVISYPVGDAGCPLGYVSGGFDQELQDISYKAFIAELRKTAIKIADFN